jgi:hypothetical protein
MANLRLRIKAGWELTMGKRLVVAALALIAWAFASSAQSWESGLSSSLDKLSANAWQPSLLTAFGTFTYADSPCQAPFLDISRTG